MIMNFGSRITDRKLANFKRLASESENWLSFVVPVPIDVFYEKWRSCATSGR